MSKINLKCGPNLKSWSTSPTETELTDPLFDAIWETIKTWDINVPGVYNGYCSATGNHVKAILDAIKKV
jgi:hypothetical protein